MHRTMPLRASGKVAEAVLLRQRALANVNYGLLACSEQLVAVLLWPCAVGGVPFGAPRRLLPCWSACVECPPLHPLYPPVCLPPSPSAAWGSSHTAD